MDQAESAFDALIRSTNVYVAPKTAMNEPSDLDLLLIGKTGNGKSATGNSILGHKAFKSKSSSSSVTTEIQYGVKRHDDGRVIKVVDGPGVGDNRMSSAVAMEMVMKSMDYAITCNPRGYHAFLLVVRFGGRFTEEDNETIIFLKKIFGNDFVSRFCILVMTCGDNFVKESKETGMSLEQWCAEQEGILKSLIKECNDRVVLFNNTTSKPEKKKKQLSELISMVDHLKNSGHRYTDANFELSMVQRQRLMVEAKEPMIREEIMIHVDLILQELNALRELEPKKKLEPLEDLCSWAEDVHQKLKEEDQGTGALHKLTETVDSLVKSVNEELNLSSRMIQEKERMDMELKEKELQMKKMMMQQQEEYDRQLKAGIAREEEQERLLKEIQETRCQREKEQKEQEEMLRKRTEEMQETLEKHSQKYDELQKDYQKIKKEHDQSLFARIAETIAYPFRKIKEAIFN